MLKRKTILEKEKYNSKIIATGVEIVSQIKGYYISFLLKTYISRRQQT
jgi:hypothetical protein